MEATGPRWHRKANVRDAGGGAKNLIKGGIPCRRGQVGRVPSKLASVYYDSVKVALGVNTVK